MAKKSKGKNKPLKKSSDQLAPELQEWSFWVALAKKVVPDIKDEGEINEVATILFSDAMAIHNEWETMSRICNRNEDRTLKAGFAVSIDRRNTPSEITVTPSYSEKHGTPIKRRVPDPAQTELPMEVTGKGGDPNDPETPPERTD